MENDPFLTESRQPDENPETKAKSSAFSRLRRGKDKQKKEQQPNGKTKKKFSATPISTSTNVGAGVLIFFPWLTFLIISLLFAFAYHHSRLATYMMVSFFTVIAITIGLIHTNERVKQISGPWYLFMSILLLMAIVFSVLCGLYNYNHYFMRYWTYDENQTYTNVLPSEPAASKADAGKIVFSASSKLDLSAAVGFKRNNRFCAVPIRDDSGDNVVNFWAVGTNCCSARGDFDCDDATDPNARSGVVILKDDIEYDDYFRAVKLSVAQNDLQLPSADSTSVTSTGSTSTTSNTGGTTSTTTTTVSSDPILVRWVLEANSLQDNFYKKGIGFFLASVFIYLFISVLLGGLFALIGKRYGGDVISTINNQIAGSRRNTAEESAVSPPEDESFTVPVTSQV